MTDPFKSLDETVAAIRQDCENRCREFADRTLAAETKAVFLEDSLTKAITARIAAERITMALITQFAIVEKVFADAKAMALKVEKTNTVPAKYDDPKPIYAEPKPMAPTNGTAAVEAHIEGALTNGTR